MSRIQHPLTLPVHQQLLHEINETIISAKLHHSHPQERTDNAEQWAYSQSLRPEPTWDQVIDLLTRARDAINQQRHDPRKY